VSSCPEYDRLSADVQKILDDLGETVSFLTEVFRAKNDQSFRRLDKQLELLVGEKERAVGALRQHVKDHGCEPTISSDPAANTQKAS
jgi:hypothetical protein